jgi:hypothetical protein
MSVNEVVEGNNCHVAILARNAHDTLSTTAQPGSTEVNSTRELARIVAAPDDVLTVALRVPQERQLA